MMEMIDKKRQSRALSAAFWPVVIGWLMIPLAAVMSHVSYWFGNGIIASLGVCAVICSIVGFAMKSTRTAWFLLSLICGLVTFLYGITNIKFPAQS